MAFLHPLSTDSPSLKVGVFIHQYNKKQTNKHHQQKTQNQNKTEVILLLQYKNNTKIYKKN